MASRGSPPKKVDMSRLCVSMLITAAVLSRAGQSTAHVTVGVRVTDECRHSSTFASIGKELPLSVPEYVNASYVVATLKAHCPDDRLNAGIQYSLTSDSSDAFTITDDELQVTAPEELKEHHVFKLTVVVAVENRTSCLGVNIFVVDNLYDFVLPIDLPADILTYNSQYVIQQLGNILGLTLMLVKVEDNTWSGCKDTNRSYMFFCASETDTNCTVHVNTSDIGMKIADNWEKISTLLQFLTSFLKSTSGDSSDSQYSLNTLSKILVAVVCLLGLIVLATIILASRLRKRCCRQDDSYGETVSCCLQNDSWMERSRCCRHRDSLQDEASLSQNNRSFNPDTQRNSIPAFEFPEEKEKHRVSLQGEAPLSQNNWSFKMDTRRHSIPAFEFPEEKEKGTLQDEAPLSQNNWSFKVDTRRHSIPGFEFPEQEEKSEVIQMTQSDELPIMNVSKGKLSSNVETQSLGLNTLARREHFRDQQMQNLQQLFQALNDDDLPPSDNTLYPNFDSDDCQEELQSNLSHVQKRHSLGLSSGAVESVKSSAAVSERSDISQTEIHDSGISETLLLLDITLDEDGELNFAASQPSDGVHQESTLVLHPSRNSVVLSQTSRSDLTNQQPPFGESKSSRGSVIMPRISHSPVTNLNPSFDKTSESQKPSSLIQDSEDTHSVTSFPTTDENSNILLSHQTKSELDEPSIVLNESSNPRTFADSATYRTPSNETPGHRDEHKTPAHRTDGNINLSHAYPRMSETDEASHAVSWNVDYSEQEGQKENKIEDSDQLSPINIRSLPFIEEGLRQEGVGDDSFASEDAVTHF